MKALILKELRERRLSILAYLIGAIGLMWLYVSLFPTLQPQMESYSKLLESFPKGISQAFGLDQRAFGTLEGFISSEMFSLMWPILLLFLSISIAGSTIAGEIDKGTLATLLSQPISRTRLFVSKYCAGFMSIATFTLLSVFSIIPLAAVYSIQYQGKNYISMAILGLMFGLAVFSFAMLLSSVTNSKGFVYSVSGGLLVLMYALNIIAGFKPSLEWVKYASLFHYFNASGVIIHNHIDTLSYVVLIGIAICCSIPALILFNKRDVSL